MMRRWILFCLSSFAMLALAAPNVPAQPGRPMPAPVPAEFRATYTELEGQLARFDRLIDSRADSRKAPPLFSGELLVANAHVGPALIRPGYERTLAASLDAFKALGIQAATVQISFPMLYRPFHRSDEEYAAYLDAYRQIAAGVRARGMKLIVKSKAIFSKGGWTSWDVASYYRGLTLDDYIRGRTEVALVIARELRPDYLAVVSEPDTEADQTGLPMNTPANSARVVTSIVSALRSAGLSGIAVGAGVGTWHPQYEAFTRAFVATPVDFIDLHIYPVNRDYLDRATTIVRMARAAGKRAAMTEAWLYKAKSDELRTGFTAETIYSRDAFSFWEPLDRKFLEVMVKFARAERLDFVSPFWTKYFYAYVTYESAKELRPQQRIALSTRVAGEAMAAGRYTQTGLTYRALITGQ